MDRRRFLAAVAGAAAIGVVAGVAPREQRTASPPSGDGPRRATPRRGRVEVSLDEVPASVQEGTDVEFAYTVSYDGHVPRTVEVRLVIEDQLIGLTRHEFVGPGSESGQLIWRATRTSLPDEGDRINARIETPTASDEGTLLVNREPPERGDIPFDRYLHAVADLGLDPAGNEPVTDQLNEVESGALIEFPAGDYRWDGTLRLSGTMLGFESVGDGRATLVVEEGYDDWLIDAHLGSEVYFSGFDIDQSAPETIGCLRLICQRVVVDDITFIGRADVWDRGAQNMLNCAITDPNGSGELRSIVHKEGHWARYGPDANGRIGIYVGSRHQGTLRIDGCDLREFGNNGIYASRNFGDVHVIDSYLENNNAAQIRIGGAGSFVEGCTVVTDPASYTGPRTHESTSFHHRGIVIEERFERSDITHQKPAGAEVRNCTIRIEDNPANGAAIHRYGNGRALRVTDTTIEYNNDDYVTAVLVSSGGHGVNPEADPPRHLELEGSTIEGTGDIDAAVMIDEADDSRIIDCTVHLEGHSQDGVHINRSTGCELSDVTIDVPGNPTSFVDADVTVTNLRESVDPGH